MTVIRGVDPRLLQTLASLGAYLEDIVLVGGWVPHVYFLMWPSERPISLRRTFDVDAAVARKVPLRGESTLDSQLEAEGYVARLGGPSAPAAQVYENTRDEALLDIEFLIPLTGSEDYGTFEIQSGVVAQGLRYLNILLDNIMEIHASAQLPGGRVVTARIRVPTPGAFIYHRGLAFVKRTRSQMRAKDLYYIYEIWMGFPGLRDDVVREIEALRHQHPASWYVRFRANLRRFFANDAAEGVLLVLPEYSTPEPEEMARQRIYRAFRSILEAVPGD